MATIPPKGFSTRPLVIYSPPRSRAWLRLYSNAYADPLGFGHAPSRFSDPRIGVPETKPYGVVYLGRTLKVCFLEAIVRDRGDARLGPLPINMSQLEHTTCAEIVPRMPLTLVDLRGDGPVRMGVPTDAVRAADPTLGQAWAIAFHEHAAAPDGIVYPSRFNGETNIALFDRALSKVRARSVSPLLDHKIELAQVIRDLKIALL
ncbi:MAG: RES family NAD+ phosphorylase [Caulobacteraceae bacterium]|nr:RES family NAD+ phosphorylase [Caulobacteraceae bacterium]